MLQTATSTYSRYYMGGFLYEGEGSTLELTEFSHPEGRVRLSGSTYAYDYTFRDHNHNVRAMFTIDATGNAEPIQTNSYYPMGMRFNQGPEYRTQDNDRLFGGKELQAELNLSTYDFGWRQYNPALGRWYNPDPMEEKYHSINPYNFTMNNPVNLYDPDGRDIIPVDGGYKFTGQDINLAYFMAVAGYSPTDMCSMATALENFGGGSYHIAVTTSGRLDFTFYGGEGRNNSLGSFSLISDKINSLSYTATQYFANHFGGWNDINISYEPSFSDGITLFNNVAQSGGNSYGNDIFSDPTITSKYTQEIFTTPGVAMEFVTTKTVKKGTSPINIVHNIRTKEIENIVLGNKYLNVSIGKNSSLSFGNDIIATGIDMNGVVSLDISFPAKEGEMKGVTFLYNGQNFINNLRYIGHSILGGAANPAFNPTPYIPVPVPGGTLIPAF